jgi:hypothetical protein
VRPRRNATPAVRRTRARPEPRARGDADRGRARRAAHEQPGAALRNRGDLLGEDCRAEDLEFVPAHRRHGCGRRREPRRRRLLGCGGRPSPSRSRSLIAATRALMSEPPVDPPSGAGGTARNLSRIGSPNQIERASASPITLSSLSVAGRRTPKLEYSSERCTSKAARVETRYMTLARRRCAYACAYRFVSTIPLFA